MWPVDDIVYGDVDGDGGDDLIASRAGDDTLIGGSGSDNGRFLAGRLL